MTKKARCCWNSDDEYLLAKLWNAGHRLPDIAKRLCRTETAIEKKLTKLKLPSRSRPGKARGSSKFDGPISMEHSMRRQDKQFIDAMLDAGYVMTEGRSTLNSSGSSR